MRAVNVTGLLFPRQRLWQRPAGRGRTATLITEHEAEASLRYPDIHYLTSSATGRRCARAIRKPSTCGRPVDFKGQVRSGRRDRQEPDVTAHSRISAASQFRVRSWQPRCVYWWSKTSSASPPGCGRARGRRLRGRCRAQRYRRPLDGQREPLRRDRARHHAARA